MVWGLTFQGASNVEEGVQTYIKSPTKVCQSFVVTTVKYGYS